MTEITLDQDHTYRRNGVIVPGVSEILKDVGLIDDRYFTEYARTKGTYVHQACQLVDSGTLNEETLDPALVGYIKAYRRYLEDAKPLWTEVERPRWHDGFNFCGTPDRVGDNCVVDLKSGSPLRFHSIQLAAYVTLCFELTWHVRRYGLYLREDGTYQLEEYKDRYDFDVFRAALVIYRAKRNQ